MNATTIWQSIDTAPRDGTTVLVCHVWKDATINRFPYYLESVWWDTLMLEWVAPGGKTYRHTPTHWMPMPTFPVS